MTYYSQLTTYSRNSISNMIHCRNITSVAHYTPLSFPAFPMCSPYSSSKKVARMIVRIGFGLSLAFVGFAHYQNPSYAESVGRGLGVLEPLGMVWGYILPGLMIVGGLLLAFGIYLNIAAWLSGIALASIPAGLMLRSAITNIPLDQTMPPAMNAFVWIIVFLLVCKGNCSGCACGTDACACPEPMSEKPVMKTTPAVMVAAKKPASKKAPAKKK